MEYLSPQGVLLPLVYGTTASPLWLELRGRSAWQATPSWTVYRLACHRLLPWLRVTFAMVPDAAWPGSDQQPWSTAPATGPVGRLGRPSVSDPWGVGSFLSPGRPTCVRCPGPPGSCSPVCPLGVLFCVCGVLGLLAPVHRCARSVCCVGCAVSWASWLLFTGVPARCVVLCVRCPGPPGSCSPVCPLRALFRVCGVLGHLAPVHRCARSVCCSACAASWAPWLLFTGVPARCVVLGVRCPGPPGSCSPVCPLGVLCWVCGVLGQLAPVHRCARSVCCFACAVSWATWLLFTGAPARCVVLRVRCPGPPGSCSPVCPLGVLFCACGVLGLLAPVHRCARSVCCFACVVSWANWLLFTGVPARCVVLRVWCPGPPGSCSPVCPLRALFRVCGVLGHLAPVHRCAARCVVLRVRCPGPPGSCSPVCPLGVLLLCVCGVLGLLAPVHRCARSVCCVGCAVSWAAWLLFTGVPARCVVLGVRRRGPPGSCSPVRPLGVLCCVCGVLGLLAPVHRCARSVCCFACAVSWASWLLFIGVPARCVVLRVRCPGPTGSCSPVCPLGVLCWVCGVLGHLAPVLRCARSVCCVASAVSWASWLLFTGVPALCVVSRVRRLGPLAPVHQCAARCVVLCVWCPGPPGSCSPVCRSVCCCACAVSWANWLLFTGVPARCVVLGVRCPGPPGSCSPVYPLRALFPVCGVLGHLAPVHRCAARCVVLRVRCPGLPGFCSPVRPLGVLCCVCGVLGLRAPVHRCARSVCWCVCAVSWANWLLFTGVPARCVVLGVRCPGPPGSFSPMCPLGVLCCVCGVLGLLAPVHRRARSVCCVGCAVSWATWLLFTGAPARCVVLGVRCPGPPGCCSPVCPLGVLFCVCGVLGLLAPVHRCARSVCCFACAVSWASWLLFTGVPARCVGVRVRCPGPTGSCSPVCPLGVLCWVCGVLGLLAPVHRCARSVCCFACAVSWVSWLLFPGVPARCVVLLCGASLRGAHSSIRTAAIVAGRGWVPSGRTHVHPDGGCSLPAGAGYPPGGHSSIRTAAVRSRQGLGTLRARTRPSGRRLFVAGRGSVPSGRTLVHPDGGWRACTCSLWPAGAGRPPGRLVVRLTFSFGRFVLLLCLAPSRLGLPPSLSLPLPFLVALALCFGCFSWPPSAWLFVRSRLVCVSRLAVGCSLVVAPPPPFFFFFFFSCAPPLSPAFSGFRPRVPWASALCVVCFVGLPLLGSPCACPSFVLSAWLLAAPWWSLPPPPLLSRGFRRCRSLLCAVCCVVLCVLGWGPAPRCCALCPPVLCCPVLCCARWVPLLVAPCPLALPVALGPCALRRCVLRCSPALCALCCVCFVVTRWCVLLFAALLCAVCVPGCWAVRSLSSPLCALLCFAVLVCSRCAVRVVRAVAGAWCCGVPWCGAGSGGLWLSAGGVFRCQCLCLAARSASLWLVWFASVPCFPVSCSVVLCCRVVLCCCALLSCCGAVGACFALLWAVVLCCVVLLVRCAVFCPVVVSACCGALFLVLCVPCLLRSVRCGALLCWLWCPASLCRVLWRCAVVWCCAVVLCCRFAVLFVFALPSCGPSCGASVVCAVVGASCCGVSLCVVVSPWAFCGVVVLLWCVVVSCCAVRCPVVSCALCRVLRCRAALWCHAGWLCCAVVCAAGVSFSFCPLFLC